MPVNINKIRLWQFAAILFLVLVPVKILRAETMAGRLSGRILLQVQAEGQAWYVNPLDENRYYLGRPTDAFNLMRQLGLGISESNYLKFQTAGAPALKGRILLRAQSAGEAYYVDPLSAKLNYLGRPADAFALMRRSGLGISNFDLKQIPVYSYPSAEAVVDKFAWKYNDQNYSLAFSFDPQLYASYQSSPKVYTYYVGQEPKDVREAFYGMFLKLRSDDNQTPAVLAELRRQAATLGLNADETAAYVLAFIQYIPYDRAKLDSGSDTPYYPFETLYLHKGICADKTFLSVLWLRTLGYGAAILDFPESNHSAAGIACPKEDSLAGSGYCYIETTNYFPVGVVPPAFNDGQAGTGIDNLENLFDASRLGKMDIKQAITGKLYQGVALVKTEIEKIRASKAALDSSLVTLKQAKSDLDAAYADIKEQEAVLSAYRRSGDISAYNRAVPAYNSAVGSYQELAEAYEKMVIEHNLVVEAYNNLYGKFYQQ